MPIDDSTVVVFKKISTKRLSVSHPRPPHFKVWIYQVHKQNKPFHFHGVRKEGGELKQTLEWSQSCCHHFRFCLQFWMIKNDSLLRWNWKINIICTNTKVWFRFLVVFSSYSFSFIKIIAQSPSKTHYSILQSLKLLHVYTLLAIFTSKYPKRLLGWNYQAPWSDALWLLVAIKRESFPCGWNSGHNWTLQTNFSHVKILLQNLKAFSVNNGWSRFIIFFFTYPHQIESG